MLYKKFQDLQQLNKKNEESILNNLNSIFGLINDIENNIKNNYKEEKKQQNFVKNNEDYIKKLLILKASIFNIIDAQHQYKNKTKINIDDENQYINNMQSYDPKKQDINYKNHNMTIYNYIDNFSIIIIDFKKNLNSNLSSKKNDSMKNLLNNIENYKNNNFNSSNILNKIDFKLKTTTGNFYLKSYENNITKINNLLYNIQKDIENYNKEKEKIEKEIEKREEKIKKYNKVNNVNIGADVISEIALSLKNIMTLNSYILFLQLFILIPLITSLVLKYKHSNEKEEYEKLSGEISKQIYKDFDKNSSIFSSQVA